MKKIISKGNFSYNVGTSILSLLDLPQPKNKRIAELTSIRSLLEEEIVKNF